MKKQLRETIIYPVLKTLELYSKDAENLIYGTACVESNCGEYIKQYPTGPALGIYQMELATAKDIYENYLAYRDNLKDKIEALRCEGLTLEENLIGNLYFATAMCRVHYLRVAEPLPNSLDDMAKYWKKYYNTNGGKGTVDKFLESYS